MGGIHSCPYSSNAPMQRAASRMGSTALASDCSASVTTQSSSETRYTLILLKTRLTYYRRWAVDLNAKDAKLAVLVDTEGRRQQQSSLAPLAPYSISASAPVERRPLIPTTLPGQWQYKTTDTRILTCLTWLILPHTSHGAVYCGVCGVCS